MNNKRHEAAYYEVQREGAERCTTYVLKDALRYALKHDGIDTTNDDVRTLVDELLNRNVAVTAEIQRRAYHV
jgi:hypothetical protein